MPSSPKLTLFTILKPCTNRHVLTLQRQTLLAWQRMDPKPEILVFGDAAGVKRLCREVGVEHYPEILRDPTGLEYVSDAFQQASNLGTGDLFCYANADIILPPDLPAVAGRVTEVLNRFLLTGRRWNMQRAFELEPPGRLWWQKLLRKSDRWGSMGTDWGIDWFVHPRHQFDDLPDLLVGRWFWDTAVLGICKAQGIPLLDATQVVRAIHQYHDYSHFPGGLTGIEESSQSNSNLVHIPPSPLPESEWRKFPWAKDMKWHEYRWSLNDADFVLTPEMFNPEH